MAPMTVRNVVNKTCPNEARIVGMNLDSSLAITCRCILQIISLDFTFAPATTAPWTLYVTGLAQAETFQQYAS
jgi:hypothetical protein